MEGTPIRPIEEIQEAARKYVKEHFAPKELNLTGAFYDEDKALWKTKGKFLAEMGLRDETWRFILLIDDVGSPIHFEMEFEKSGKKR